MYTLKPSNQVYVPRLQPIRTGLPIPEHTHPDIALVSQHNTEPLLLNSIMLRDALLNSPELLKMLGLKVTKITPKEPKKEKQSIEEESEK